MIGLPRWMRAGFTPVLVVYTLVVGLQSVAASRAAAYPLLALVLFAAVALPLLRRTAPRALVLAASAVAVVVPPLAMVDLDPATVSYEAGGWFVAAVATLAVLLLAHRRTAEALVPLAGLIVTTGLWSGLRGLLAVGVTSVVLLLAVVVLAGWALERTARGMTQFEMAAREAAELRVAQEAFHRQREVRLAATEEVASGMLRRIVETGGRLDDAERRECRVLEQTIRDEVRGRRLLNAAIRREVLAARRRGASVQVLDDGGLDDVPDEVREPLLDRVAEAIAPLVSGRIVIRTVAEAGGAAVTVVATTPDPMAAALGLDDDDEVDLWLELAAPHPDLAVAA